MHVYVHEHMLIIRGQLVQESTKFSSLFMFNSNFSGKPFLVLWLISLQ